MRLAFYTYSYTDRLDMPIEPALEKIAATGYDGIDISGMRSTSQLCPVFGVPLSTHADH